MYENVMKIHGFRMQMIEKLMEKFMKNHDHQLWSTNVRSLLSATIKTNQSMSVDNRCTISEYWEILGAYTDEVLSLLMVFINVF